MPISDYHVVGDANSARPVPPTPASSIDYDNTSSGISATDVQGAIDELASGSGGGAVTGVKGDSESTYRTGNVNITKANIGLSNVNNTADADKPISTATQTALNGKLDTSLKGANNGLAELDSNGKIPNSQLPSYVDDVLEYASLSAFPATGESGKIYVALDTNKTYRWSGTTYVEISPSLALGETSSTAYRGDRGKTAYEHSQSDHSSIAPAFSEASTRTNIASGESFATMFGKIKKFFSDLKTVAFTGSFNDLSDQPTIPTVNNGTLTVKQNGTSKGTFTANQSGNTTVELTDTTYSDATQSASGLMSVTDKTKLDGIASGAQVNSITGVKGDKESTYRTGNVNLTPSNIGATIFLGNLTSLGSGTPASAAKTYYTDNIPNNSVCLAYNTSGTEYTIIFSRGGSVNYGSILKYTYDTKYMYILRIKGGTWQSMDWEQISCGYARTAGTADTATTATKVGSSSVGSATQPMYLDNGTPTACTYTLGKSVPSNAVFSDTTTGTTYAAGSVPANTTFATNGSVKNVYDDAKAFTLYIMKRARANITNDLDNLLTAISEQNLERYGYKIGDYFRTQRYTYILGDYNTFYGTYQGTSGNWINTNHLCIVALDDTGITSYWHNTNDLTNVGYYNSTIRLDLITGSLLNNIKADMKSLFGGTTGLEHILPVRRLLSAGLNGSVWVPDEYLSLLSENQVVGASIYSANPHQTGEAINQLEVFRKYNFPELLDFEANGYYWLRNMQSASEVCVVSSAGDIWHIPPATAAHKVAVCFNLY
jgi:hypothetical protein